MIQRIQTIFLCLVISGMAAFLFLPVWMKSDPASGDLVVLYTYGLKAIKSSQVEWSYIPFIFSGIIAMVVIWIALYEIFQYKNRLTQIKLGMVNSLFMTVAMVLIVFLAIRTQNSQLPDLPGKFKTGLFAPVFSLIFNSLANRYIKKDEELVRSVDRIR
jgi:hypothetical protein